MMLQTCAENQTRPGPEHRADAIAERVQTRLGDSPEGRPAQSRPSPAATAVALPRVGGLHHRYVWAEAA
jgi:hypothetical protein